jgi:hypothetical protein
MEEKWWKMWHWRGGSNNRVSACSSMPGAEVASVQMYSSFILVQYQLRQQVERVSGIPPCYWWLTAVGSILVVEIALASIIKTETGWG